MLFCQEGFLWQDFCSVLARSGLGMSYARTELRVYTPWKNGAVEQCGMMNDNKARIRTCNFKN